MKLNIITVFITTLTISNISLARDLASPELELASRVAQISQDNEELTRQITSRINIKELPISKYLSFVILKNGCSPFSQTLEEIKMEDDSFPEQTAVLRKHLNLCHRSNKALRNFDISEISADKEASRISEE